MRLSVGPKSYQWFRAGKMSAFRYTWVAGFRFTCVTHTHLVPKQFHEAVSQIFMILSSAAVAM